MGGLEITLEGQVLNKDGKPVENLYAAGEVTGGIHGAKRKRSLRAPFFCLMNILICLHNILISFYSLQEGWIFF